MMTFRTINSSKSRPRAKHPSKQLFRVVLISMVLAILAGCSKEPAIPISFYVLDEQELVLDDDVKTLPKNLAARPALVVSRLDRVVLEATNRSFSIKMQPSDAVRFEEISRGAHGKQCVIVIGETVLSKSLIRETFSAEAALRFQVRPDIDLKMVHQGLHRLTR